MTLTLRTHGEIQTELTRPANLEIFRSGLKLAEKRGRIDQKEAHTHRINLMLITAAAGKQIFKGATGRVLAAIAGLGKQPSGVTDLREAGAMAKQIGTHLQFAVLALDPDRLRGFSDKEKEALSHQLRSLVTYIQERGHFLERHNKWHSPTSA